MKKLLTIISLDIVSSLPMRMLAALAAIFAAATASYGQGYVNFYNNNATKISVYGIVDPNWANETYYFELLVAPTNVTTISPSLAGWTDTGDYATNAQLLGRIAPANNDPYGDGGVQIPGYGTNAIANFVVVGWSGAIANNYSGFLAYYDGGAYDGIPYAYPYPFGISAVAHDVYLAPSGGPYNNIWGLAISGQIQGMDLEVPEPGTFALAGLGAAALVAFRRRA